MLRREFTRQQQFILNHSLDEESHAYHGHKGRRFDEAVEAIRNAIPPESLGSPEVQSALIQLATVSRQLGRYRLYGQMVCDLSRLRDETINPAMVTEYLDRVLELNPDRDKVKWNIVPQVLPPGDNHLLTHHLPRLCFMVDEVVTNSLRWSPYHPAELLILVGDRWPLIVQVVEFGAGRVAAMTGLFSFPEKELRPYSDVLPPDRRGGGTQLYERVLTETELTVHFAERPGGGRVYVIRHRPLRWPRNGEGETHGET